MDEQYYVVTTANNNFFISSAEDDNIYLTKLLSEAFLYDELWKAKEVADLYGLNVHEVTFTQRFDCGVWKK
ncbi:hypothetical protein [Ligilactobacillus saerimneri]|uniref:hypothetical protein n=1 Tax=Ligilactobacillus saerimneri TaxID=228229 RepID=UPI0024BA7608|nr:hypothetical protein [Ligilactobacillus saerimneri]